VLKSFLFITIISELNKKFVYKSAFYSHIPQLQKLLNINMNVCNFKS
jgi:hypothetical protein